MVNMKKNKTDIFVWFAIMSNINEGKTEKSGKVKVIIESDGKLWWGK